MTNPRLGDKENGKTRQRTMARLSKKRTKKRGRRWRTFARQKRSRSRVRIPSGPIDPQASTLPTPKPQKIRKKREKQTPLLCSPPSVLPLVVVVVEKETKWEIIMKITAPLRRLFSLVFLFFFESAPPPSGLPFFVGGTRLLLANFLLSSSSALGLGLATLCPISFVLLLLPTPFLKFSLVRPPCPQKRRPLCRKNK
ncbi:hypothetical protein pclt_cds_14 [Pandoravirus celtis]|uniref:Uncharacterized protein n=1 Tax=Pandoravirus celtis TaxID=2568002 RepID=A0A4D6EFE5_9VIRU|nr:hypothetical protein pclt_cds_14 [Pandoravirus celtis]